MKFKIDFKIFIFLILFYFTKQIDKYVLIIFFAFIHELGHLFAGMMLGMRPNKIELKPYGLSISFNILPKDFNKKIKQGNIMELKKIIVALAGPIVNIILIIIFSNCKLDNRLEYIYANLLLFLFNLLPIYPLDGGRVLKGLLHIKLGKRKAEKYMNTVSYICMMIITAISSILILELKNISIFLIVIVLWCLVFKEDIYLKRKNKIYDLIEKSIEI